MLALHEHNEQHAGEKILGLLAAGQSVALISDAGTPAISDPGAHLVAAAHAAGFRVTPLPGANAAITALCAAGLPERHFLFWGFLAHGAAQRRHELETLKDAPHLLVFYESPHRILACIDDLQQVLGARRRITFARELTKLYETLHTCTLEQARPWPKPTPTGSAANSCCWCPAPKHFRRRASARKDGTPWKSCWRNCR
jgi:16S rRNA (cytidine1402-2'-O)-methyltransferase